MTEGMADVNRSDADDRLMAALERLAGIQVSISELNQEAARIRRHIQDFDVNVDALNVLAIVRSKDEKFGRGKVLDDVIRYARQTGMPMGGAQGDEDILRSPDSLVRSATPTPAHERSVESGEERASSDRLRVAAQVAAAVVVTIGLFVLIH